MRDTAFPKPFTYVGLILAVLYLVVPPAVMFKVQTLSTLAVSISVIVAPVWYVWGGLILHRRAKG